MKRLTDIPYRFLRADSAKPTLAVDFLDIYPPYRSQITNNQLFTRI